MARPSWLPKGFRQRAQVPDLRPRLGPCAPASSKIGWRPPERGKHAAVEWDSYNQAREFLNAGDPAQALRHLRAIDRANSPIWSPLACLEAECLAALGQREEAVELLEITALRDPSNYWLFYNLASLYRELGNRDMALDATWRVHACLGWQESPTHGYVFTHDYFAANIPAWTDWFSRLVLAAPIDCLEIGSWQGGSATWLLDKIVGPRGGHLSCIDTFEGSSEHAAWIGGIGATLEELFDRNIARTGRAAQCRKIVGRSQDVLRRLADERFDFIYIDGAHEAKYVIQDALLAWPLLRDGAFMLFDDTHFEFADRPEQNAQTAISAFQSWFGDEMDVLTPPQERQLLVRKRGG
jgi:predicted O-methyltransferase YrrM